MKNSIILIVLLLISTLSHAGIYKWVDADGNIHFGDQKPETEKAETVKINVNTYTSVSVENGGDSTDSRVVMYSTDWCGYCKKARRYFVKNNIPFVEYDIEKNTKARRAYDKLGGTGVPVILFADKRMNGFSEAAFDRIYP